MLRFPVECLDERTGETRTVYIVQKVMGERDEEFLLDALGRVYRKRGPGRLGVVLQSEPPSEVTEETAKKQVRTRGTRGSHVPPQPAEPSQPRPIGFTE
jgi:hypothetical protein